MIRAGNENLRKYFRPFLIFRAIIIVADVPFGVVKNGGSRRNRQPLFKASDPL